METKKDIWVFLSHSREDYRNVCIVRNTLEQYGFRPIMFFLRCMEETEEELKNLIRREIDARPTLIYCKSNAAENKSTFAPFELEHMRKTNRSYKTIIVDNARNTEEII